MCDRYKEAISLLACGELPVGEREAVERHLAECASCRDDYEALQRLCGRIRNLAEQEDLAEAPGGLSERLEESLRPAAHTVRWVALSTAACVLIGLAVWLISSAKTNGAQTRTKQEPSVSTASTPHPAATTTDVPQASWAAYHRAWLQSPATLDKMLARDAAARLKPERNLAGLNMRGLLRELLEENHNENHSMRSRSAGSVV
jgi:anti-sigma factor RsiW